MVQFRKTCQYFSAKRRVCLLKVQIGKKYSFQSKLPKLFSSLNVDWCFDTPTYFYFSSNKKVAGAPNLIQITNFFWEMIFRKKIPLDARIAVVTNLKVFFGLKLQFFWLKFQRSLKQCLKPQSMYLLKTFRGHVGCSFDNCGELFR